MSLSRFYRIMPPPLTVTCQTTMTYCAALNLKDGLVFASDSRTNAGVDHIATFRKMHLFQQPDERAIVLLNSGNLATLSRCSPS